MVVYISLISYIIILIINVFAVYYGVKFILFFIGKIKNGLKGGLLKMKKAKLKKRKFKVTKKFIEVEKENKKETKENEIPQEA